MIRLKILNIIWVNNIFWLRHSWIFWSNSPSRMLFPRWVWCLIPRLLIPSWVWYLVSRLLVPRRSTRVLWILVIVIRKSLVALPRVLRYNPTLVIVLILRYIGLIAYIRLIPSIAIILLYLPTILWWLIGWLVSPRVCIVLVGVWLVPRWTHR